MLVLAEFFFPGRVVSGWYSKTTLHWYPVASKTNPAPVAYDNVKRPFKLQIGDEADQDDSRTNSLMYSSSTAQIYLLLLCIVACRLHIIAALLHKQYMNANDIESFVP